MKVYRFKCKDCGATRYEKLDDVRYMCEYCGYVEEVHREENKEQKVEVRESEKEPIINFDEIRTEARLKPQTTHYIILLFACIFGGTFGIHKFLDRKFISGVIYICTAGLFGFGIMIDVFIIVIRLIHAHNDEKHNDYGSGGIEERDYD